MLGADHQIGRRRRGERFRAAEQAAWESRTGAEDINALPATELEPQAFETEYGPIPSEFRWFPAVCGGGPVGSERVDSTRELPATLRKFRAEFGPPRGWTLTGVFVIGWDGGGNPFGIHASTGRVLVEDHDVGGIHEMSPSFTAFLAEGLSLSGTAEPRAPAESEGGSSERCRGSSGPSLC